MNNVFLYAHGGSGNHGCEALVRSTTDILSAAGIAERITLISSNPQEDITYGIDKLCSIEKDINPWPRKSIEFAKAYLQLKLNKDYIPLEKLRYKKTINLVQKGDFALSIGGDNYCYADVEKYIMLHDMLLERKAKTVLWGCSVEPELLNNPKIAKDIAGYHLITARETITYNAIKQVNPNTVLVPDSAFFLKTKKKELPAGFTEGEYVGINISPMVIGKESKKNIALKNYENLLRHILDTTDMKVLLIPHVVWKDVDDRQPLQKLYEKFSQSERVAIVEDCSCCELKGYIAHCRFFIGARTHATIAAYSSCVPTLVVGYSVKAKGIAKDLFGTYENYVLPVQNLNDDDDLTKAFEFIYQNENEIKQKLLRTIPSYADKSRFCSTLKDRL